MSEILKISGLGPIKNIKIEVKPLTILVGPQASGKSLVAQVLYFFRTLRSELARRYTPDMDSAKSWQNEVVRKILDELRGEPFGYFANKTARISYENAKKGNNWSVSINSSNRRVTVNPDLKKDMAQWVDLWNNDSDKLFYETPEETVFIPTERTLLTKFFESEPSILFSKYQPLAFRRFADRLAGAQRHNKYRLKLKKKSPEKIHPRFEHILKAQRRALKGDAYIPETGPQVWKFRIYPGGKEKILPLAILASGQMEAWPFFAVAASYGVFKNLKMSFIFEEPETHLHPAAQRIIMETITFLVHWTHPFFMTTHSPYIIYTVNNLMQTHISYSGKVPEEKAFLNPKDVAAYRLTSDGEAASIVDKETGLMASEEVDATANQLGREFDELLDLEEGRG